MREKVIITTTIIVLTIIIIELIKDRFKKYEE